MSFRLKKFLALSASAGSGKTFALSVRYISLLFLDVSPSTILALTFTNKAANEMRERITNVLNNLEYESDYLDAISKELGKDKNIILLQVKEVQNKFNSSEVSIITIDKFLNKILRSFCWYVGVEQDFEIQSDIRDIIVQKFLASLNESEYEDLLYFAYSQNINLGSITDILYNLIDKAKEIGEPSFDIKPLNKDAILKEAYIIKDYYLNSVNASQSAKKAVDFNSFEELMQRGKSWLTKDTLKEYSYFKKKEIYNESLEVNFAQLKELLGEYFINSEKILLKKLFSLFHKFQETRLLYKSKNNHLDFYDITNYVYSLLRGRIDSDFLYYRIDASIDHILIDEFQDTSILQFEILKPLIDEIVSSPQSDSFKTFFYVGDTKQSIYRFRGGKRELYNFLLSHYKDYGLIKNELNMNYRSRSEVIDFVNDLFEYKIDGYFRQFYPQDAIGGFVSITKDKEILEQVADSIKILQSNNINYNDMAILAFNNKDIITIKNYLELKFNNISVVTESSTKLINQQNIKALIELVRYIYFKEEFYKSNFLSLMKIELQCSLHPIYITTDTLKQNLFSLSLQYKLLDEYMVRFLEICEKYDDLHDFIYNIEYLNQNISSNKFDGIKILTIHKSKGLEFNNVIVCDMLSSKKSKNEKLIFNYDGVSLKAIYYRQKLKESFDEKYDSALKQEKVLEDIDLINTLYVAFTRAKTNLFICQKEKSSSFEILLLESKTSGKIATQEIKNITKESIEESNFSISNWGRQDDFIKNENINENIDYDAINYGLAFHECVELLDKFNIGSLKSSIEYITNRYGTILQGKISKLKSDVEMMLKNSEFQSLIKGEIYKEYGFIYNKKIGYIDTLIKSDNQITILDYKTSSPTSYNSYIVQLQFYKSAIKHIFKIEVKAYLIFIDDIVTIKEVI